MDLNQQKYDKTDKDSFISAKSKVQRRLFGMALAHKRGKLDKKYITPQIEKLSSEFSETKLAKIAGTNQIIHKGKNAGKNRIPYKKAKANGTRKSDSKSTE